MKISDGGIATIKQFEGLRLDAYLDAVNVLTIGYGHTGPDVKMGQSITEDEALELLRLDVEEFEECVTQNVIVELTQGQFDALVCFAYNVGCGALKSSTLLKLLNAGNYEAAAQQFPKWNKAGGQVLTGLTRRRLAEKSLFLA